MRKAIKILFLLALGVAGIQQPSNADNLGPYPKLYVFGDSLSDTGNDFILTTKMIESGALPPDFPAIPPSVSPHKTYNRGRFGNGPVAVEYLWKILKFDTSVQVKPSESVKNLFRESAVSFAYGGSQSGMTNITPGGFPVLGALGQVDRFIGTYGNNTIPKSALYVIWTGANNYLLGKPTPTPTDVVGDITAAIHNLYMAGARTILVPNLPDLGTLPILSDSNFSFPPGTSAALTQLTLAHNASLATALQGMPVKNPGIKLVYVDVFSLFKQLGTFMNIGTGPGGGCLFLNPYDCQDVVNFKAPRNLYWDVEHPTTEAQKIIALEMVKKLFLQ